MGGGGDMPAINIPQPIDQTQAFADLMDQTRDQESQDWMNRMEEILLQEEEFQQMADEVQEQEMIEEDQLEEEVIEEETEAQQEAEVIQDPTAPGQDIDDFLYGFYGLIDDDEYYDDDYDEDEDDYY